MNKHSANLKIYPNNQASQDCFRAEDFSVRIGDTLILKHLNLSIQRKMIHCIIGPSGAGKSTLIRCFNRISDETDELRTEGSIYYEGKNIFEPSQNTSELRRKVGMVFQKPAVFPKSIRENVLMGVQYHKKLTRLEKLQLVEEKLKAVSLWSEVSHRLDETARSLSAGQQQRLCLARTLAVEPDVILLDEPTSALDPVSSRAIEDLMLRLKNEYTIVFVTHNIQQAHRIADQVTFICNGKIIESGEKEQIFNHPKSKQTKNYLNEEFCDC